MSIVVSASRADAVVSAAARLSEGSIVAVPTDTVYGLATRIDRPAAVGRLYAIKERPSHKPIALLVASKQQALGLAREASPAAMRLMDTLWPGGLTIVIEAGPRVPDSVLAGGTKVGVRMPNHAFVLELAAVCGPLAVTSANRSGEPELTTASAVQSALGQRVDMIVDGGPSPSGIPSTVVEVTPSEVRVLRDGAVPSEVIMALVGDVRATQA